MTRISILGGLISVTVGGSVTNPAGNNTDIQFNDSGAFGGSDAFTFNKTTNVVTLGAIGTAGTIISPATSASSVGLTLTVQGGPGGATSGAGGALSLKGGVPVDGQGGGVSINAQNGATITATSQSGGAVGFTGGNGILGGNGGAATMTSGNGGATGNGGTVLISAGAGGGTSGNGGSISFSGGGSTNGNGGNISFTCGNGGGTGNNGGITFAGGTGGSGTAATLTFNNFSTTGAQTATFVATNKPGVATGAPFTWLRVSIGATAGWIPVFAN